MESTENLNYECAVGPKIGKFWIFWVGQKFSLLGSEVVQFALSWVLTIIYKDPIILSMSMFLTFIPRLIFGPLSGVIADKYDYKKMIVIFDGLQALTTLVLIIIIQFGLENLWLYLGFILLRATFQTFHGPVVTALSGATIPKSMVSRYQGMNQLFNNIIMMMAPILGAVLLAFAGTQQALWVDIITFAIAFGLLIITPLKKNINTGKPLETDKHGKKKSILKQFTEGLSVLRDIPGLPAILLIGVSANFLLSPFNTLMTYLINVTHGGTEIDMAIISVSMQAAMIIGSIIMTLKKTWKRKSIVMVGTTIVLFMGIIAMALAPIGNIFFLSVAGFFAVLFIPMMQTMMVTILQTSIPVQKMGRIFALLGMMMGMATPLGYLLSGPLAAEFGEIPLLIGSSVLGILSALAIGYFGKIIKIDHVG